jgi:tRNA(Ile)-lysidine synthase
MSYSAPLPGHSDLTLIRPLLDVPRSDLDAYCRENGLTPRQDATNDDTSYTRNRLRRETLPYLRGLAPQIDRRLLQLSEIAALEDDFVDEALHKAIDTYVEREEGRINLSQGWFTHMHLALQKRFILWAARELGADDVSYERIAAALKIVRHGQTGQRVQLKDGIHFRRDYRYVVIEREDKRLSDDFADRLLDANEVPVTIPGRTRINKEWFLVASLETLDEPDMRLSLSGNAQVILRRPREGDHFPPLGMNGHILKVNRWMSNHKVPRDVRNLVPLLVVDGEVAAIYWITWTVSEHFAVKPDSSRIVYFLLSRK